MVDSRIQIRHNTLMDSNKGNTMSWETMSELEQLESIYCETHKDVYGVKARWYKAESVEQAKADLAILQAEAEKVWAQEKQAQQDAIAAFEELAKSYGGVETAKRWQHQAYDTRGDDEFLCYHLGLPYGYFKKVA
jgi:hypothetical protein